MSKIPFIFLLLSLVIISWSVANSNVFAQAEYSPHFYIPQRIVYLRDEVKDLPEVLNFKNDASLSAFFSTKGSADAISRSGKKMMEEADEILIKSDLQNKVENEELGNFSDYQEIRLTDNLIRPNSILYWFEKKLEEIYLKNFKLPKKKLFKKNLYYSQKKISTFQQYGYTISRKHRSELINDYKKNIFQMVQTLEELKSENNKDFLPMLIRFQKTMMSQKEGLKEVVNDEVTEKTVNELFLQIFKKINGLTIKHDFLKLVYKLEIPESGEYQIYIKDKGEYKIPFSESEIVKLENTNIEKKMTNDYEGWELLELRFFEQGTKDYILVKPEAGENLLEDNFKISNYSPNTLFRISLKYKNPGDRAVFGINEGKEGKLFDYVLLPTEENFEPFEIYFKSSEDATNQASLNLSVPEYEDLKVEKMKPPELMLVNKWRKLKKNEMGSWPNITFVKINPTKYKVKVEGAKEPYTLVFSESFHQGWKAYIDETQNSKLKTQNQYGETVASYFDGEIKEGTHRNIFLDRNTFETWSKKPLPEERHLLANSYANSWYIKPEDSAGREDYEIIIEFRPQRLFYLGLLVSLVTLIGCGAYLGLVLIFRKR